MEAREAAGLDRKRQQFSMQRDFGEAQLAHRPGAHARRRGEPLTSVPLARARSGPVQGVRWREVHPRRGRRRHRSEPKDRKIVVAVNGSHRPTPPFAMRQEMPATPAHKPDPSFDLEAEQVVLGEFLVDEDTGPTSARPSS